MMGMTELDRKLQAQLLSGRRVEGDRLMLDDAVLLGALDGSRPLTAGERTALQASPLTTRRLRTLADGRRAQTAPHRWQGSGGMLRAADSGTALETLVTDDGAWRLHFVGARVILQLDPQSPLAATLLREGQPLRVRDGAGSTVLEGTLDTDGECEGPWPFADAPAVHFQRHGARFTVEPTGTKAC
ncbi:hypothetical protein LK542_06855 [Massilia sp. IC2-477]|uniref:hypothetical protein n=1 Tax=unclassified Massilia TaxID=2609279 RepID=UPI001D118A46|nr:MULTISPECIES: hypothetical protein [unclassified Massilia]MCC2955330.1 hypothetical protein [Massilia sp. IC2-477]MCC2972570.1 hypothetical protein [Massilia sp. IC2-476]